MKCPNIWADKAGPYSVFPPVFPLFFWLFFRDIVRYKSADPDEQTSDVLFYVLLD